MATVVYTSGLPFGHWGQRRGWNAVFPGPLPQTVTTPSVKPRVGKYADSWTSNLIYPIRNCRNENRTFIFLPSSPSKFTLQAIHYSLGKQPEYETIKGQGRHINESTGTATQTLEKKVELAEALQRQDSRPRSLPAYLRAEVEGQSQQSCFLPKNSNNRWKPQLSSTTLDSGLSAHPSKNKGLWLFWVNGLPVTSPWKKHLHRAQ